jgi:chemotaxis protein MotB
MPEEAKASRTPAPDDERAPDTTMVLYTSLVLILLTFFIMISAKANFDETKYSKVVESVTQTFGPMRGGSSAIGSESGLDIDQASLSDRPTAPPVQDPEMSQIRSVLSPALLDEQARIVHNKGQRIITLSSGLLFLPDSSELTDEAREAVLAIARVVRGADIPIAIEGHTDNLPPTTEGADNWDISVDRALAVLYLMASEGGVPLERLSAFGYGGERPIVANNSPANRQKNNRVDLVLDFDATRAGSLRGLTPQDRSFDFQGFEFELPEKPHEGEGEVY